jgi:septal ring factor EnvC (AmiA/AmiB activator)
MFKTTTGYANTAVGDSALYTNVGGSKNTAIGQGADVAGAGYTNATAIGYGAIASGSNKVQIGNASVTEIRGQVSWTTASDSRLKKDIKNSKYGLSTVMQLRPVDYILKSNQLKQVGFIAQEVKKLIPEVVTGKEGDVSKGEILGITYENIVPVLTKAIQEQQHEIQDQKKAIAQQQKEIDELKKMMQALLNKK